MKHEVRDLGVVSMVQQNLPALNEWKTSFKWPLLEKNSYACIQKRNGTQAKRTKTPPYGWGMKKMSNKILSCYHSKISCVLTGKSFWFMSKTWLQVCQGSLQCSPHFPLAVSWSTWHSGLQEKSTGCLLCIQFCESMHRN